MADTILVEVKPQYKIDTNKRVKAKIEAALTYCKETGLQYSIFDPGRLSLEQLSSLRESGTIRLSESSEQGFQKLTCQPAPEPVKYPDP